MANPGGIGLIEIRAQNPSRLAKFYSELLGYKIEFNQGYMILSCGEGPSIGVVPRPDEPGVGGIPYFGVSNTDEVLARAVELGGSEVEPAADMMGMGRGAKLHDTEGNMIGLWGPLSTEGAATAESAPQPAKPAKKAKAAKKVATPAKKAAAKPAKKAAKKATAKKVAKTAKKAAAPAKKAAAKPAKKVARTAKKAATPAKKAAAKPAKKAAKKATAKPAKKARKKK